MSARKKHGSGQAWGDAPAAHRLVAPCSKKPQAASLCQAPAFACKPEVEARTAPRIQGDRPQLYRGLEPRPVGAESASIEDAPSVRSTDLNSPPNLLNQPKGLSMAKIARVYLQLAMKFVPVADLLKSAHLLQSRTRKTVIPRRYTLCEVDQKSRQELPTAKPPLSAPENSPASGSIFGPIFTGQKIPRRILSGSVVIPGLTAMSGTLSAPNPKTDPAPSLGWRGETPRKPIGIVEGGAA